MDMILNEYSLEAQFHNLEDFSECLLRSFLPLLKQIEKLRFSVFSSSQLYGRSVTPKDCLYDFYRLKGDAAVTRLKKLLADLLDEGPYWDQNPATGIQGRYHCRYTREIPNCFTETFERNGILLSFEHEGYRDDTLEIEKDGITEQINNARIWEQLNSHLVRLGILKKWENSFELWDGIKFEIRFQEDHHALAHFHVSKAGEFQASYRLPELIRLAGQIPGDEEKRVLRWAREHKEAICALWNKNHGERIYINLEEKDSDES